MKKILVIGILLMLATQMDAQRFFGQAHSGIMRTYYGIDDRYQAGFAPVGFVLGGGWTQHQLGFEYYFTAQDPRFVYYNLNGTERFREEYNESFFGVTYRYATSTDPAYGFGGVFRGTVGLHSAERNLYVQDIKISREGFKVSPSVKLSAGLSIPLFDKLHLVIEGHGLANYRELENPSATLSRDAFFAVHYGITAGFSFAYGLE